MATEEVGNACSSTTTVQGGAVTWVATAGTSADGATASGDGTINTIKLLPNQNQSSFECGTFTADNPPLSSNPEAFTGEDGDYAIGTVAQTGSCVTLSAPGDFTAFSINSGEYIGYYAASGNMYKATTGGNDYANSGDRMQSSGYSHWEQVNEVVQIHGVNTLSGGDPPAASPQIIRINISMLMKLFPAAFLFAGVVNNPDLNRRDSFNPMNWIRKKRGTHD